MAIVLADRVKENTSSTGTGTITLTGTLAGYQPFSVIGEGNTTYYALVNGSSWETGIGTYSSNTLTRDTVFASSTGSKISLSGASEVFLTYPATKLSDIGKGLYVGTTPPNDTTLLWLDESDPNGVGVYGIPGGGTAGQVLVKSSANNYDVSWSALGTGAYATISDYLTMATAASTYANLTGSSLTVTSIKETKTALAANDINLNAGNFFTKTITTATTLTVSNVPSTGTAASFVLELTNGGSATVTWWTGMKWEGGTAPTLTAAGVDILGFYTHDGGTTWRGLVMAKDSK